MLGGALVFVASALALALTGGTLTALLLGTALLGIGLITTLLLPRRHHDGERPADDSAVGVLGLLGRPGVFRAILVSCVVLATVDITIVYLPAWGAERGMTAGFVGVLLSVRAGASMASRLFLGRLVGHLGRPRLMVVGLLVSAVSLGSFVLPLGPPAARGDDHAAGPGARGRGSR